MMIYNFFYILILLNFFTAFSIDPQKNEFNGKFIYDFNKELNELYILNEKLEFSTYELTTNSLKEFSQINISNDLKVNNIDWDYIVKNQLIDINKIVGFSDLNLVKFKNKVF